MSRHLYINGNLLDLIESEPIAFSFQVNDIGELEDRFANYSNNFLVPKTQNNIRALYYSNDVNITTFAPYRKLPCRYIEDGVEIIGHDGYAIIKSASDQFEITIFSGIFDLFDLIGDKTLRDLDISELDHEYEIQTIIDLNEANGNVVWPLIDWGVYSPTANVDVRYQRPAIKFSYLVDKIFTTFGYSYSGAVLNEYRYTNLAITINNDELINSEEVRLSHSAKLIARVWIADIIRTDPRLGGTVDLVKYLQYPTDHTGTVQQSSFIGDNFTFVNHFIPTNNITVLAMQSQVNQTMNYHLKQWIIGYGSVGVYKNGKAIGGNTLLTAENQREPLELDLSGIELKPFDIIYVLLSFPVGLGVQVLQSSDNDYSYQHFESVNADEYLSEIKYNSVIPDISIKDFLRNFANIFGMFYQVDGRKSVKLTMFKEFSENLEDADDWSDKLDLSDEPELRYQIESYGQINFLKFAPQQFDGAISNNGIGDSQFVVDDKNLTPEKNLIDLIFSASVPYYNIRTTTDQPSIGNIGIRVPRYTLIKADDYAPYKEYNEGDIVRYGNQIWFSNDDVEENEYPGTSVKWELSNYQYEQTVSTNTRLVLLRKLSEAGITNVTYEDGTTTEAVSSDNIPLAYFVDSSSTEEFQLGWNPLLEGYYRPVRQMLNRTKIVNCGMRLSKIDISTLDFSKLKYISYFNNYFYLNKIAEYIEGRSAVCEFIRF